MSRGKPKAPRVLEFSWDGRIRSARELFRLLHDFLNKYGYEHVYHELKDVPGTIEGTATFWDSLTGRKDRTKVNWWLLVNGAILAITGVVVCIKGFNAISTTYEGVITGIFIFILGSTVAGKCNTKLRNSISLHVEGETYRVRADKREGTSSEGYDVVSNCRVVFSGKVGKPVPQPVINERAARSESIAYEVYKLSKKTSDWASLKSEFDSLTADFQSLRPRIEVPEAITDHKKE